MPGERKLKRREEEGRKKKNSSRSKFKTRKCQALALFRREPTDSRVTARALATMDGALFNGWLRQRKRKQRTGKFGGQAFIRGPRFDFCFKTFVSHDHEPTEEPIRPTFRAHCAHPLYCSLGGAYGERGEFTRLLDLVPNGHLETFFASHRAR